MFKRFLTHSLAAIRWWWQLPNWLKYGKIVAIILVVASLPLLDGARQWMQYRSIYSTYYDHFYEEYIKTETRHRAHYYADYYADFYANYYTNPQYRAALANQLPSATAENTSYPASSPVANLTINHAGLDLIKGFEGLELEPYADAGGKLTIGYGHLIKPGEFYSRLSEAQAYALLREDVRVAEAYIKRFVNVPLTENQFAALVSLVYNIGPTNFRRSTLLKVLNKGDYAAAAAEFPRWNKVGTETLRGLVRRRASEKSLFERG